ncbi:MAG TPA: hypothetical protein VFY10_11820, partial [Dehalococcoidia bacterium]|nr:hypothetical protein [Dehalococcoidia bacterium]
VATLIGTPEAVAASAVVVAVAALVVMVAAPSVRDYGLVERAMVAGTNSDAPTAAAARSVDP